MFAEAVKTVMGFTLPVVTSLKTVGGECASGPATFVVVNKDGWIVTAAHIFKQFNDLAAAETRTRALEAEAARANDPSLPRHDRRRIAATAKGPQNKDIDKWSAWWGYDGWSVDHTSARQVEVADIAVAKLIGFDSSLVKNYPIFKNVSQELQPGSSLCRLGFPFFKIGTEYDPAAQSFQLTNLPLPIFPNEGILSRIQYIVATDPAGKPLPAGPFPLKMLETSSAGIRGQSGGPIFDQKGTVWGIQSSTRSYEMDLNTKEKQYYHVGVAAHVETIFGLFKEMGVDVQISDA